MRKSKLKAAHRLDITEYEADLQASRAREGIHAARVKELEEHLLQVARIDKGQEQMLKETNRAALAELTGVWSENGNLRDELKAVNAALDRAVQDRDDYYRQVQAARRAAESLQQALYPWKISSGGAGTIMSGIIDTKTSLGPNWSQTYSGAGLGCATTKAAREMAERGEELREAGYGMKR